MTLHVRAHFDGRAIVPDEPVDLPVNEPLELRIETSSSVRNDMAGRLTALERAEARAVGGVNLPGTALSRENIYEDEG